MFNSKEKAEAIKKFAAGEGDTGSAEVQCAVLTSRIKNLTEHLREHKKDFSSRNGLMVLVARRKRLLKYLKRTNSERYLKLIGALGLKTI
ncbi:MAG: 30S ribosomal protein S15 [Rickettsiales bacterium]|jgi:small subunit ribosomal protein S15|nr:30S ribosomal protein S15 [Rickettsiales bacterium]